MATELVASSEIILGWTFTNNEDLSDPVDPGRVRIQQAFVNGDGDDEANQIWRGRRVVSVATPNDDLDLAGVLENVFGNAVNFAEIKAILIRNLGLDNGDGTFTPAIGEDLKVGGAGTNPWTAPFADSGTPGTSRITVPAGGKLYLESPLAGFAVSPGSSDVLRIAHSGSLDDITFDVVLIGVE